MDARLTPKAEREIERSFEMNRRMWRLMDLVAVEFRTDPMSVQCFDARLVSEIVELVAERKRMKDKGNPFTT